MKNKTGITEAAAAAFITSGALGVLPFFGVEMDTVQATNFGIFFGAIAVIIIRQIKKWINRRSSAEVAKDRLVSDVKYKGGTND